MFNLTTCMSHIWVGFAEVLLSGPRLEEGKIGLVRCWDHARVQSSEWWLVTDSVCILCGLRSMVYVTVGCPSLCLFRSIELCSSVRQVCWSIGRPVGRISMDTSIVGADARQQQRRSTALSSKCGQCYMDHWYTSCQPWVSEPAYAIWLHSMSPMWIALNCSTCMRAAHSDTTRQKLQKLVAVDIITCI